MGESRPSEEAIALFTNVFGYAPDPEALHAGECWQAERIDAALRRAKVEGRQEGKDYAWNEAAMRAACAAHRACCGIEADNSQGKIHGCCVVCGVPWPCETAQFFLFKADAQRALDAEREKVKELEEWQRVVVGTGTDQEAVVRMAATEYTKTAVQCWKDENAKLTAQLATLQAQLAGKDTVILQMGEQAAVLAKENMAVKAQLRQVEGQSKQQAEEAVIVFAKYTTLRQLVEALPVVDGRMDVECGACYYIRSFVAGQYGVVCGLITEPSTALAIKALLEYRATLAAQDAGNVCTNHFSDGSKIFPSRHCECKPHPTEERS